jgi:8-oxo-dGTP pyrophosphatase MutT (NUDIX family)
MLKQDLKKVRSKKYLKLQYNDKMIRIYFDNKRLVIKGGNEKSNPDAGETRNYIDQISKKTSPAEIIINCANEEETLIVIFSFFKEIAAAGGVVMNERNEILFIHRKGKWDLPKGKIEVGETAKQAAIREAREECGLKNLEIIEQLSTTYHTYMEDDQILLKETFWYLMKTFDKELIPQTEEGITKAEWKGIAAKQEVYSNTYSSVKDVLEKAW